jgi:hypothetical protein
VKSPHTRCIIRSAIYGPHAACSHDCDVVSRFAWAMGARNEPLPADVPPLARVAWKQGEAETRRARR